ncbi:MAG: Glu-tRNA(Gln) amidotransferase subunit GatD [Methanobrevibacter sp.]|jgi:glutamyl-tRNA(Gln) amidotransferase subunit D|nr:Glu-tRNA(Gln) amidotransferase subunit GatD [Candidatus Methanovirga basalitermitum]
MVYKEKTANFLRKANVSVGDLISASKENVNYEGMLLDRSGNSDDEHIVLKLDNGYNIGVGIDSCEIRLIEKGKPPKIEYSKIDIGKDPNKKDILIASTGGTVSSIIDYKTGAVHPALSANDLLKAYPQLLDLANIDVKEIYSILSENMKVEYWVNIAKSIRSEIESGVDGVVVAHGTDTMHYSSAALSFILETPVPIVFTGAQKSSDRPSSDSFINLMNSIGAASSDIAEVTVCMHDTLDDSYCSLHRGTKVRKMHTSRRDTFRSINNEPLANLKDGHISSINTNNYIKRNDRELNLRSSMEPKVAIVKSFPGITDDVINLYIDNNYKGLLIEGTGLGHLPNCILKTITRGIEEGMVIAMSSQCIYGRVNMNIYSTGRELLNAGIISCEDMTPETAYVKLSWALGQSENLEEVKNIMATNIVGELNNKTSLKHFLN